MVNTANVGGEAHFAIPLPATPLLLGLRFVTQGFALDSAVPSGFTASDGVIFVAGR